MDLERATSMIQALPSMSKTIIDNTLYEKVYSFLTSVLNSLGDDSQSIVSLCQQSRLLDCLNEACILDPHPDYRITSLCIRLLGQFVHHGRGSVFKLVEQDQYADLLAIVTNGLTSSEPTLRCACLEACRHFLWCQESQTWLMQHRNATTLLAFAILDQSIYVAAEACRLFSDLLHLENRESLLQLMDPSDLIRSILHQPVDQNLSTSIIGTGLGGENEQQVRSALTFCWSIVNLKSLAALEYLRSTHLLSNLLQLIPIHEDKLIRVRIAEILLTLFTYDDRPLETISYVSSDKQTNLTDAYYMVTDLVTRLMPVVDIELLITALSLLESAAVLLGRIFSTKEDLDVATDGLHEMLYSPLYTIYNIIATKERPQSLPIEYQNVKVIIGASASGSKNGILQQIFRVLNRLTSVLPKTIEAPTFMDFFSVLSTASTYLDPTLLKEVFTLLKNSLKQTANGVHTEARTEHRDLLKKPIQAMIQTIGKIDLGCKSFIIVLNLFKDLLGSADIGPLVLDAARDFVDILKLKFIDTEWDNRDATVQFVGQLFEPNDNEKGTTETSYDCRLQFAIENNLPLDVFQRIYDSEPYVKASALEVLQKMMKSQEGWLYIQQHKVSKDLASTLPSFLYDTEAFVRRAALDAIISLVQNRSCQGMIVGRTEGHAKQGSLSPYVLDKLLNDDDTEVRIRICRLIGNLWKLYYHEKHEARKKTQEQKEWIQFFPEISPGKMLTEAATDPNRVVRQEGVKVIEEILMTYGEEDNTNDKTLKRPLTKPDKDEFEESFIHELRENVNLTQQKQTLDPEHLYQEAFEIDAATMTQATMTANSEDDVNMLDCE